MNAQERTALLNELKHYTFRRAKNKLARLDPKGRLAYYRNAQLAGQLLTKFELNGLGVDVTLVEKLNPTPKPGWLGNRKKAQFELVEVVVEPQPQNRV
jgi:hypothetical protein